MIPSEQSVPQVSPPTDVDSFFEQWIVKSLERNPELAKKVNNIYQINISRKGTIFSSWVLDLTGKGSVYRNKNQDIKCGLTLDESDLLKALQDKNHWRTLFMKRKMGLKGPRVALEKLQQFWIEADIYKNRKPQEHKDLNQHFFDSIASNGFKSDIIFYTLKNRMHEEKDIVKKLSGIMQIEITKDNKKSIWTLDFSRPLGENVYPGPAKEKTVCVVNMEDESFAKMMVNKLNPQKAFMTGKLKIKGQIMAIYRLFSVWIDAAFVKKRAPELPFITELLFESELIPGLKSETMIFQMIQRLVKLPQLCQEPGGVYYFDITKDGKIASKWKLDFTTGKECGIFKRLPIDTESPTETLITIEDKDFVLLVLNKLDVKKAMSSARIKGDISLASKITQIFQMPLLKSKL